jgi:hypothetical protein
MVQEDKYYLRDENSIVIDTQKFSGGQVVKYYFIDGKPTFLYWFSVNVPFWRQAKLRGRWFVGV